MRIGSFCLYSDLQPIQRAGKPERIKLSQLFFASKRPVLPQNRVKLRFLRATEKSRHPRGSKVAHFCFTCSFRVSSAAVPAGWLGNQAGSELFCFLFFKTKPRADLRTRLRRHPRPRLYVKLLEGISSVSDRSPSRRKRGSSANPLTDSWSLIAQVLFRN